MNAGIIACMMQRGKNYALQTGKWNLMQTENKKILLKNFKA